MPRKKTGAQLDREIAEVVGTAPSSQPRRQPGAPTDTNLFTLADLVLRNGGQSTFGNRLDRVDLPHIKRCLAGGLVTVSSPTTLTLTPEGRNSVLRRLRKDHASQSAAFARDPSRFDARDRAQIEKRQAAIERLEAAV